MDGQKATSQEKLDQMLGTGAITVEDYDRLSKALRASDSATANAPDMAGAPTQKRLRRNWAHHQIAGVCAGFGKYFALDPVIVRIVAVVLAVIAPPVTLLCYLVLAFVLPWDDAAAAREAPPAHHPVAFASCLFLLLGIVPLLLGLFVAPKFVQVYSELGAELPGITQVAINVLGGFIRLPFGAFSYAALAALATGALTALYLACQSRTARWVCVTCSMVAGALWSVFLVAGLYCGLLNVGHAIR